MAHWNRALLLTGIVLLLPFVIYSATINVAVGQRSIQAGIDMARDGDTVLVAAGIYTGFGNRNISFRGKAVVCRSESGPRQTIIDGEYYWRAFYVHEGEGTFTVIEGFTIRNCRAGTSANGGGIYVDGASPTIKYNIIYDCYTCSIGKISTISTFSIPRV